MHVLGLWEEATNSHREHADTTSWQVKSRNLLAVRSQQ